MTKLLSFSVLLASLLTISMQANACFGGFVRLNEDDGLSAEGIYGSKGLMMTVAQLKEKSIKEKQPVVVFTNNKTKEFSHQVIYLGSIEDSGGIIQSSYIVKDLKTGQEKVYVLKSNYRGNGIRARGIAPQGQDREANAEQLGIFDSAEVSGCD